MKRFVVNFFEAYKKEVFFLCGVAILGIGYFGLQLDYRELISLVPFLVLTIFYVLPIKKTSKLKQSLRTISGIKILVIAFCWAGVTVLIPIVHMKIGVSWEVLGVFTQRLLFVLVITIPFDVRDLSHDDTSLKTIPQLLGVSNAKRLGLFLLMLFLGLSVVLSSQDSSRLRIEFVVALIALALLVRSGENQHKYYSAFLVESIPILWMALILV